MNDFNFQETKFKSLKQFKGMVQSNMKILSSFIHLQVVPNLYEFPSSVQHKGRYFKECS